jgi:alpha-glucosidase
MRTPMPWRDAPGGGFTDPTVRPWLPLGDLAACNVEAQRGDPGSVLHLARDLIGLRRELHDLALGDYRRLGTPPGTWAWSRGARVVVAVNMTDRAGEVPGVSGRVRVGTDRRRDGESVDGTLRLDGWEAVVMERSEGSRVGQDPGGPSRSQARPPRR